MKISSFRYLNKQGLKNLRTKRMLTFTSISILTACMLLMGCCILVVLNINNQLNLVEDQNTVVLFIESRTSNERISEIEDEIIEIGNIKKIYFKSKEEALQEIKNSVDEKYKVAYESLDADTLPDSFVVTVNDLGNNDETVAKLAQIENIESMRDNREFVSRLKQIRNSVTIIGIAIVVLLFIVSFFIVYNTINASMYNRRLEIQIMRCVGATKRFIRYPFLIEGILIGIISMIISMLLVYLLYYLTEKYILSGLVPFNDAFLPLIISCFVIGILAGLISSAKSVSKFLKKEGSEAYDG